MTTQSRPQPYGAILTSFFKRLVRIEAILRLIISNSRIIALIVLRGEEESRVVMNFGARQASP